VINIRLLIVFFSLILTLNISNVYAEQIKLNPNAEREIKSDVHVELKEFDPKTRIASFDMLWDIEDKQTKQPFQAIVKAYSYSGDFNLNEGLDSGGFYEIWQKVGENYHPVKTDFELLLWPFEQYHMPTFLQFDNNVSLLVNTPIDAVSVGEMAENSDWGVRTVVKDSSVAEMNRIIPDSHPYNEFEIKSVFKYEVIIEHSSQYIKSNIVNFLLPFIPISLMIWHSLTRIFLSKQIHLGMFFGLLSVSVFILIHIGTIIPYDFTLIQAVLISMMVLYSANFIHKLKKIMLNQTPLPQNQFVIYN